jgi:fatty-acyl-CoA synthase
VTARAPSGPHPIGPDALRTWGRLAPEHVAVVQAERDRRLGYAELDREASRWAAWLRAAGAARNARVATLAGSRIEMAALYFACGRVGAALVPLNWRLAAAELAPILRDAAPAILLGEGRFRAAAEEAARAAGFAGPWLDLDADVPGLERRGGPEEPDERLAPDDPALILYTSGTTGRPKGAILPHRQILANAIATTTAWRLGADDVATVSTPFFHTGGWNVFATPLWHRGGTVVMFDRFAPDDFLDGLARERCTVTLAVPTQLVMLLESRRWGMPLPALRTFFSGGAPLPPVVAERVRAAGYRLREGYGLTECGPNCFAISDAAAVRRPGRVGWPVPFLETRLVAAGEGEPAVGEPGELWLRGPQVFGGYLHAPELTAQVLDDDGWLRTGDLATRDADGAYAICGRLKEMFISGGENVFPGEVEAVLARCPGVAEAAVIGVPDSRWGEVGRAFVVRQPGAQLRPDAVLAHVERHLARYKVPRSVVFVEALPRLGSGKIDRAALARAEAG